MLVLRTARTYPGWLRAKSCCDVRPRCPAELLGGPLAGMLPGRFNLFERESDGALRNLSCQGQTTTYCARSLGQQQYVAVILRYRKLDFHSRTHTRARVWR